ncbi:hypothetical protein [Endozoicomonas atrinae]|uniref:hypothetical protein n=1 Tax=Endozoicomonas atrinae TaxID=1333660 RepID=UPI000824C6FC|nr:hypothetical protein [Endozoicomonas atrinae]
MFRHSWLLSTLREAHEIRTRQNWSRQQILNHQQQNFTKLLNYVWEHSPFYRDYYSSHGITAESLADIKVTDLPIINKEILMDNFDTVSNDPFLKRRPLETWIHSDEPLGLYKNHYVVIHSSGSSGTMGIFAYDRHAWSRSRGVMIARNSISLRGKHLFRRKRIAYCGAIHGRFASVTSAVTTSPLVANLQLC